MFEQGKRDVVNHADRLSKLTPGRSGDLSVRRNNLVALTPSGVPYGEFHSGQVPVLDLEGNQKDGSFDPSSEWRMHLKIYQELDYNAIVHTHSPWATTVAVLNEPLPPVHYVLAFACGEIPLVEYETYGTEELAGKVVNTLKSSDCRAVLLANHGQLAVGDNLEEAFEIAEAVEFTSRIYCQARQSGRPVRLSAEEMKRVAEKFKDYGQDK